MKLLSLSVILNEELLEDMCNPQISVIIPAYNAQEHIRECLESVLAQSFPNFEIVVVNDGSEDNTEQIVASIAASDARVRQIITRNQGLSCARNTGIDNAKGSWITFVDSDDMLMPEALSNLISGMEVTGCDIVVGDWCRRLDDVGGDASVMAVDSIELTEKTLYQKKWNSSACAKLFSKKLLCREKFTPGVWYEDLDFFYRIYLLTDRIAVTDAVVYYYRDNPASFVNNFTSRRLDVLGVTERMEAYLNEKCPELLPAARDRRLSANFNMFALMALNSTSADLSERMNACWNIIKKYRMMCLFDRKSRMKNKAGVLLSFMGRRMFTAVASFVYR